MLQEKLVKFTSYLKINLFQLKRYALFIVNLEIF